MGLLSCEYCCSCKCSLELSERGREVQVSAFKGGCYSSSSLLLLILLLPAIVMNTRMYVQGIIGGGGGFLYLIFDLCV